MFGRARSLSPSHFVSAFLIHPRSVLPFHLTTVPGDRRQKSPMSSELSPRVAAQRPVPPYLTCVMVVRVGRRSTWQTRSYLTVPMVPHAVSRLSGSPDGALG